MAQRMTVEALTTYITGDSGNPLARRIAGWVGASPSYRAFAETYRDKIRKKARGARSQEERNDLLFELQVAAWLLEERRFAVEYERFSAVRQRGPDFTVTFRGHTKFNVEVKRLRGGKGESARDEGIASSRVIRSVCDKLGQMQPGEANVLAIGVETAADGEELAQTMRLLLQRAESKDEGFLARHGFAGSRDFFRQYLRLSAIIVRPVSGAAPFPTILWHNPQSRHPLPREITTILQRLPHN